MENKKIFITGSAGFIGSNLSLFLRQQGFKVTGYDIRSNPKDDVRDFTRLFKAVQAFRPDGVIHLAAIARVEDCYSRPGDCVAVNYGGTANVLEVIRKIPLKNNSPFRKGSTPEAGGISSPWLIFSSSREVFGNPKKFPVKESDSKNPLNVYAVNKLAAEELIKDYARNYGLKARVVRFSGVYTGLNDQLKRVIPRFLISALRGQSLVIEGGRQFFDFVHIDDAIAAVFQCVKDFQKRPSVTFDDFTLSGGKAISVKDLAKLIIRITESESDLRFIQPRTYDVIGFRNNPAKVKKILKWSPKIDIESGLKKCLKEFQSSR